MRQLDYLVDIKGNEALLERFLKAIFDGTCKTAKEYPEPYLLDTGETFLNSSVIKYFFQARSFDKDYYIEFFEKLRKLESQGFNAFSYDIEQWIDKRIKGKFFDVKKDNWNIIIEKKQKPDVSLSDEDKEVLSFMCYVAVCYIKYGPSYAIVSANELFDMVTALGSDEVAQLKKNGTGTLSADSVQYKDDNMSCKANDVFATITIKIKEADEASYSKALDFTNNLLKAGFPKSYEIKFSANEKKLLPIKKLPKCGQHYMFAGAVAYPALHGKMQEYVQLAKHKWEWYNNLEAEECAMPSSFAVFALGLEGEQYFDLITDYMQTVDEEHQSLQEHFTPVFVDKYGITAASIKVFLNCLLSMQEHPTKKSFLPHFKHTESLQLLAREKENFYEQYLKDAEEEQEMPLSEQESFTAYCWSSILYSIFGASKDYDKIAKGMEPAARQIFDTLRAGIS